MTTRREPLPAHREPVREWLPGAGAGVRRLADKLGAWDQEFICAAHGRDSTLENAMSRCHAFGPLPAEASADVAGIIDVMNTRQKHFAQTGVTARDIEAWLSASRRRTPARRLSTRPGFSPRRPRESQQVHSGAPEILLRHSPKSQLGS
jgi:hypothetical protein